MVSPDFNRISKKIDRLAQQASRSPKQIAQSSGKTFERSIRSEINSIAPSGKLRHVSKSGARVGVKTTLGGNEHLATAAVTAFGPLQLIEKNTKDHDIPKARGSRRVRGPSGRLSQRRVATKRTFDQNKVLYINGKFVTGPVHHPGTKGQHPFERGVRAVQKKAVADSIVELANAVGSILR